MNLNDDFERRVVLHTATARWQDSPQPGVQRIALDRVGDEVARATSLVRFAAGSHFPAHVHGGGEEILVLAGVFSDESGDYPAGCYLRNPPGSRHAPASVEGCTLLVKLWQFAPDDQASVSLDTRRLPWQRSGIAGLAELALHEHGDVRTALQRLEPGTECPSQCFPGGEELFVLFGQLSDEAGDYPAGTWLRNPRGSCVRRHSREGAVVFVKTGHVGAPTCWDVAGKELSSTILS
ncbi:cupin domain-containing protein [Pseudomonas sp. AN-1]|uniref:cupin domain-containing protein n=1 Tax=Pseudomonas sp. AN-1 TaxID=3096605 RepID=UPI002A6AF7D3|nr:cupin domain-containing protein [Pseudomonas sp. AN-1]WPP45605.1 cupin domain-containing protein [Pseudomonas sp. AN-1]